MADTESDAPNPGFQNGRDIKPPNGGCVRILVLLGAGYLAFLLYFLVSFKGPDGSASVPVSRAKSDMRSLATALEAYSIDNEPEPYVSEAGGARNAENGSYPPCAAGAQGVNASAKPDDPAATISTFALRPRGGTFLTTPIAYITEITRDRLSPGGKAYFGYYTRDTWWVLQSTGPDGVYDVPDLSQLPTTPAGKPDVDRIRVLVYDPSNGSKSGGDILSVSGVGPL